jgi:hypothetical protein
MSTRCGASSVVVVFWMCVWFLFYFTKLRRSARAGSHRGRLRGCEAGEGSDDNGCRSLGAGRYRGEGKGKKGRWTEHSKEKKHGCLR